MNGGRLVVALALAFGGGWVLASWRSLSQYHRLRVQLMLTEANQDHTLCLEAIRKLNSYASEQETRADAAQVVDAAEQITREGS